MVREMTCECNERIGASIDTLKDFNEIKSFFEDQVFKGIFMEVPPGTPYYTWKKDGVVKAWYATKWYRCKLCGCLWEINFPDFPANGFVRKFDDGIYEERGF